MRVVEKITKEVEYENLIDVICNQCGESCIPTDATITNSDGIQHKEAYGLVESTVMGGFFSTSLADMTSYTFSVCEKCLSGWFDQFKIQPETKDLDLP